MNQSEFIRQRKKYFKKDAPPKVLSGEDILRERALRQEEERIKNMPEQTNTLTIQDIANRKRIKQHRPIIQTKNIKFLKKKVKREDLVFSKIKYEPVIKKIPEPKKSILKVSDIKKRFKGVKDTTPIQRIVPNADVSHFFRKKRGECP
jgi:hypothetical protein